MTTATLAPLITPDDPDIAFAEPAQPASPFVQPVSVDPPLPVSPPDTFGLVELILKNRRLLERLIREPQFHSALLPRLLAVSLCGFTLFGVAMTFVLHASKVWPALNPLSLVLEDSTARMLEFRSGAVTVRNSLALVTAYTCGLIAATGVCLPSLYFYGLLAGVRLSMLDVALHSLKAKATSAVTLIGLMPIYLTLAIGAVIVGLSDKALACVLWGGLLLPFIAGLWGTWSLYRGFVLAAGSSVRICFLRRLVLSWSVCYTAVSPVMIFTVWQVLGQQ